MAAFPNHVNLDVDVRPRVAWRIVALQCVLLFLSAFAGAAAAISCLR